MTDLLAIFRAEGIVVVEEGMWRERARPFDFHPVGIMVHHTGSKGQGRDGLNVLIDGRPDLPGPLCQASPRDDGSLSLISAGYCNHAGMGNSSVLAHVRREVAPKGRARELGLRDDMGGNQWFYGLEVDNSGLGEPYPPEQYDTTVRACAALCRHHGWTAARIVLHAEWTARKVDWSLPADPLRAAVAQRLSGKHTPHPHPKPVPKPKPIPKPPHHRLLTVTAPMMHGSDVEWVQRRLVTLGYLKVSQVDGWYGRDTRAAVIRAQQRLGIEADGKVGVITYRKLEHT